MTLITTYNLSKSYGPIDIFLGLSLRIPPNSRIALVGANGIGKTTLLRVLADIESASDGKVQCSSGLTIGYLPQKAELSSERTLWEEILTAFDKLRGQEKELQRIEELMSQPGKATEEDISRYGGLQAEFERRGGYTYESRIRQVLGGLGFDETAYKMPLTKLSGGERTRAFLARLLLSASDLLILDEPTNHLDIQAVEWLEGYLKNYPGAALIVSHDRYFIDQVCDHIWEMSRGGFETYRGNYSAYLEQRQGRWERRQELFLAEKARLENELDYVKRNIAGQNTSQAQGKLRRLSRNIQALEQLGIQALQGKTWAEISQNVHTTTSSMNVQEAHHRIKALRNPVSRPQRLAMNLRTKQRGGNLVLRTKNLEVGYQDADQPLFSAPDITLRRQECAALIGPNGAGKTTFLKTILEELIPWNGQVKLGANLDVGYFAQAHEDLNPENTILEEIQEVSPKFSAGELRGYLASYLFRGEDVFKKVSVLSGGERGRLALAKLAMGDANLLLLDEPTNHLDIPSQETLQAVLAEYSGTILLVSHDRYLINALGTQIWEINVDQAGLQVFNGSYKEYQAERTKIALANENEENAEEKALAYRTQKIAKNRAKAKERHRETRLEEVEERIIQLEEKLEKLGAKLASPPDDAGKVRMMGQVYAAVEEELNTLMAEWEKLM
ncbi:MAG: ABC-F family ATP-binding cassette domain-containing protein [Chloroflexota bacterium]|nr:ABC-F family ATP-binding cassette domain-containing protein [Chloroflexota bacterium]